MTTTINGDRYEYFINMYGDALVVVLPDGTRERYPFSGGCWTDGRQTAGSLDVRAPRRPARWRAFVRRMYAELTSPF